MTEVLSSLVAGDHVLYEDESDAHMLPTLGSMWMLRGKQVRVPMPGTNRKKSVFGAMDIRTGALIHLIFDRKRALEFIEFLEHIVSYYSAGKIHIILYNFGVPKARRVKVWLASNPRVKLYFLPCYMSQLNSIEKVWQHMKACASANGLYGSMASLVDAINVFLSSLHHLSNPDSYRKDMSVGTEFTSGHLLYAWILMRTPVTFGH